MSDNTPPHDLASRLRQAAQALGPEPVPLHTLAALHGSAAPGTLLILLAAPCLLPVPGVGTALGMGLLAMALAMWRGQASTVLSGRVAGFTMPAQWARRVLRLLAALHDIAARVTRKRLKQLADAGQHGVAAGGVAVMAVLIVLPIPLGNVLPALALMLLGLGLALRDGLAVLLAALMAVAALLFTATLGWLAWWAGWSWLGGLVR